MISGEAIAQTSPFKVSQDIRKWKDGERLFFEIFPTLSSSTDQGQRDHIDFEFDELGKIDVKGLKGSHKAGYVLLELMAVNGKHGWCHKNSGADFFAFQFPEGFYIASKKDLLSFLEATLPAWEAPARENGNKDYESMLYKYSGRPNRKDVFTYIKKTDLTNLPHCFYPTT